MNIKELRQALCLTQAELAAKIGVDVLTVSRWERGIVTPSKLAQKEIDKLIAKAMR
jgi:DNA-binding transcriptional regulator YiaG